MELPHPQVPGPIGGFRRGGQQRRALLARQARDLLRQFRPGAEVGALHLQAEVEQVEARRAARRLRQVVTDLRQHGRGVRERSRCAAVRFQQAGQLDQPLLQPRVEPAASGSLAQRLGDRRGPVDRIDLGRQRLVLGLPGRIRHRRGVVAHALRVFRVRGAVDLGAQFLESRILFREPGGDLPHLLHRGRVLAVRQHPYAGAQHRVVDVEPLRTRGEFLEQGTTAGTLVLLLDGAAVEQRTAHDPAVVGRHQVALGEHLPELVVETGCGHGLAGVDPSQQCGNHVAAGAQLLRAIAPLAVLVPATVRLAGVGLGRQHRAVAAEPLDRHEWPARVGLHLLDPAAVALDRRVGAVGRAGREDGQHERAEDGARGYGSGHFRFLLLSAAFRGDWSKLPGEGSGSGGRNATRSTAGSPLHDVHRLQSKSGPATMERTRRWPSSLTVTQLPWP